MSEEKPDNELLVAFAKEARQRCDVISTGLDTGTSDFETLRQEAHALHGTASTLGLRRLGRERGRLREHTPATVHRQHAVAMVSAPARQQGPHAVVVDGAVHEHHAGQGGVEGLAAFDAWELDGAEDAALVFIVADHAAFATEGAFDGEVGAALDEAEVVGVGRGGAGEVAGFLDERLSFHIFFETCFGEYQRTPTSFYHGGRNH